MSSDNPFLLTVLQQFYSARRFENSDTQAKALQCIPLEKLKENANKKFLAVQQQSKDEVNQATLQDILLLELLAWFKESFFTWVNSPECKFCKGKTNISHISTDHSLAPTNRVELHKCTACGQLTPFPRYNDLNVLLTTRKGRCGEWANVFTLLCRAIGWDCRFVLDETDHVWTEVFSVSQNRWMHCDPCENVCDTPLIYESGWGKKISYVMAYSGDEVQDVTWRYTSNHAATLSRRNKCSEIELINTLVSLRDQKWKEFTPEKKDQLTKRLLNELVELMQERKPNDSEQQGRASGSLAWRLARGETQVDTNLSYTWNVNAEELLYEKFVVQYSSALNKYERLSIDEMGISEMIQGWERGVYKSSNVSRIEEKDWKMTYLARTAGSNEGRVSWKVFVDSNDDKIINNVHLTFSTQLFENGICKVQIVGNNGSIVDVTEEICDTSVLRGCKSIEICVHLSGGKGNVAWQHAQLFRQSISDTKFPFILRVTFADAKSDE